MPPKAARLFCVHSWMPSKRLRLPTELPLAPHSLWELQHPITAPTQRVVDWKKASLHPGEGALRRQGQHTVPSPPALLCPTLSSPVPPSVVVNDDLKIRIPRSISEPQGQLQP